MKEQKQTIFVELDALLDTRAATIASFGKEAMDKAITKEYFNRLNDDFSLPGYDVKYKGRDNSLLKNTMITSVLSVIGSFVKTTLQNNLNSPYVYRPCVVINTYPYVLSDIESRDLISAIVKSTNEEADVELVSMDNDTLTPTYFNNNVSVAVMYHGLDWLEVQSEAGRFAKKACPDIVLFCPKLAKLKQHNMEKDPFDVLESIAAPIISLKFLPISVFSMIVNPFK